MPTIVTTSWKTRAKSDRASSARAAKAGSSWCRRSDRLGRHERLPIPQSQRQDPRRREVPARQRAGANRPFYAADPRQRAFPPRGRRPRRVQQSRRRRRRAARHRRPFARVHDLVRLAWRPIRILARLACGTDAFAQLARTIDRRAVLQRSARARASRSRSATRPSIPKKASASKRALRGTRGRDPVHRQHVTTATSPTSSSRRRRAPSQDDLPVFQFAPGKADFYGFEAQVRGEARPMLSASTGPASFRRTPSAPR